MSDTPKPRRARLTHEQKIARLTADMDREWAALDEAIRGVMRRVVVDLRSIEGTKARVPTEIRNLCTGTAATLDGWLSSKPTEAP